MKKLHFTVPTDKMPGAWHGSYPVAYARLFAALQGTRHAVAEVGTDGGACLLAYQEYFTESEIIGCDVNPPPSVLSGQPRIKHYQQDAYTPQFVETLRAYGPFAVMIDDGSHFLHHQMFFAEHYPTLLAPEGLCIIEDVQSYDHVSALIGKIPQGFMGYAIDLRWADDRYDSLLLCIERKGT